jgi:hypothetical protein
MTRSWWARLSTSFGELENHEIGGAAFFQTAQTIKSANLRRVPPMRQHRQADQAFARSHLAGTRFSSRYADRPACNAVLTLCAPPGRLGERSASAGRPSHGCGRAPKRPHECLERLVKSLERTDIRSIGRQGPGSEVVSLGVGGHRRFLRQGRLLPSSSLPGVIGFTSADVRCDQDASRSPRRREPTTFPVCPSRAPLLS